MLRREPYEPAPRHQTLVAGAVPVRPPYVNPRNCGLQLCLAISRVSNRIWPPARRNDHFRSASSLIGRLEYAMLYFPCALKRLCVCVHSSCAASRPFCGSSPVDVDPYPHYRTCLRASQLVGTVSLYEPPSPNRRNTLTPTSHYRKICPVRRRFCPFARSSTNYLLGRLPDLHLSCVASALRDGRSNHAPLRSAPGRKPRLATRNLTSTNRR